MLGFCIYKDWLIRNLILINYRKFFHNAELICKFTTPYDMLEDLPERPYCLQIVMFLKK